MDAWLSPSPVNFMISSGRTGRMTPNPMASTSTVMKMKTTLFMSGDGRYHGSGGRPERPAGRAEWFRFPGGPYSRSSAGCVQWPNAGGCHHEQEQGQLGSCVRPPGRLAADRGGARVEAP